MGQWTETQIRFDVKKPRDRTRATTIPKTPLKAPGGSLGWRGTGDGPDEPGPGRTDLSPGTGVPGPGARLGRNPRSMAKVYLDRKTIPLQWHSATECEVCKKLANADCG